MRFIKLFGESRQHKCLKIGKSGRVRDTQLNWLLRYTVWVLRTFKRKESQRRITSEHYLRYRYFVRQRYFNYKSTSFTIE